MNYATERGSEKMPDKKQKDSKEQNKEQQLNLCGEFLEHALKVMNKKSAVLGVKAALFVISVAICKLLLHS